MIDDEGTSCAVYFFLVMISLPHSLVFFLFSCYV